MKTSATLTLTLAVVACGGGSSSTPDLVGTWSASKYEFVSTSSTTRVELISQGVSATLVLKADRSYEVIVRSPGQPDETISGAWSNSADVLTLRESGRSGEQQFQYTLSGNILTLSGANAEYDFDGDGTMEEAKLNVSAVRG